MVVDGMVGCLPNKHFIFALKSNRLVALTPDDREKGNFVRIDESNLPDNTPVHGFLNDYHDEVLLLRRVFTNKDDSIGVLYLVCSDLQCDKDKFINGYQKRKPPTIPLLRWFPAMW